MTNRRLHPFAGSQLYWEERYARGGNSGAGSYNQLAVFKASVLNDFVADHGVKSVMEFGSGDGSQLSLARYPDYIGIDVSSTAIELCRSKFGHDLTKQFFLSDELPSTLTADLTLSLDVIYHLVEDNVFERYMKDLFAHSTRWVIIYSSNHEEITSAEHVRHRQFADWVRLQQPTWGLKQTIPNAYPLDARSPETTSFADFYIYERVFSGPGIGGG